MPSSLTVVFLSLLLATPALLFWLWLVILPARVAILCPEKCQCETGGFFVRCVSESFTAVPLIHLTNVQDLGFSNSNITFLKKDSFVSLTELGLLGIYNGGVREIELGAFNGLTKMTELRMSGNKISEIFRGTFENLNSLEFIYFYDNSLEHLDSDVFSGLFNLKHINLAYNKLQCLHPDTFLLLPKLQTLYLYNNPTLHIPTDRNFINSPSLSYLDITHCNVSSLSVETFANISALELLDLRYNDIRNLDINILLKLQTLKLNNNPGLQIPTDRNFINSHSLSHLDISDCRISSVSVETFANVTALELLDLSYNNLKTLDIKILRALPKLSALYLVGNRLQCDCRLQEVWRWCEDRNIQTEKWGMVPKCDTPSEVKGLRWGVLEKARCLEGNIEYYGDYNSKRYNKTGIDEDLFYENIFTFLQKNEVALYAVPFVFGTVSNVIVLIIIIRNKNMRTLPNMYIINLAITDIIYLTAVFSEAYANRISFMWQYDEFMCRFISFCRRLTIGLSAYSVAAFSFQRYRVIVNPIEVLLSSPRTWRVTVATVCGVWIVAALFAVPSALSKYTCDGIPVSNYITYHKLVVIFELLVSCVLPLCVVAFSYVMTAYYLVVSSRSISEGTQHPQLNTRRNTAKTVMGLALVFLISYVPYHIIWTYINYWKNYSFSFLITTTNTDHLKNTFPYSYLISTFFLLINPCLNPVALFCTSSPFRQHLKRYLTCFCKTNSPPTDIELTRST